MQKNPSSLWDIIASTVVASSKAIWVVTFYPFSHELTSSPYNRFHTLNVAPNGPAMRKFLINNERMRRARVSEKEKSISKHIRCHNNLLSHDERVSERRGKTATKQFFNEEIKLPAGDNMMHTQFR